MKEQLEALAKNRRGLAITIVLLATFGLVFVVPKVFASLEPGGRKIFWLSFAVSFGAMMALLFPKKKEVAPPKKQKKPVSSSLSYQQLLDKVGLCLWELKKQQIWAYTCLGMGWLLLWIGKWSGHPHYSHPIFAVPVFIFAFLGATQSWEKVRKLDADVAKFTLEGIAQEKKKSSLKSNRFRAFASSYEGIGMWKFAFVRVSPSLMIIFSLFNAGPLSFLINHYSLPAWASHAVTGLALGALFFAFARSACRPYYWMLSKMKAAA